MRQITSNEYWNQQNTGKIFGKTILEILKCKIDAWTQMMGWTTTTKPPAATSMAPPKKDPPPSVTQPVPPTEVTNEG